MGEEGFVFRKRFLQFMQVVFLQKQKRFGTEHFQVAFVKDFFEKVGFFIELGVEAFDELAIFLSVFAFDDGGDVVLAGEFFFEANEVVMVTFVGANKVVAIGAELKIGDRV